MGQKMLASIAVAACMACICTVGGMLGSLVCLFAFVPGLMIVSRRPLQAESLAQAGMECLRWVLSTVVFVLCVVFLIPVTPLVLFDGVSPITVGLVVLSPLFGMNVAVFATALCGHENIGDDQSV